MKKKKQNKNIQVGIVALILLTLYHFNLDSGRFLLSLPISSITSISSLCLFLFLSILSLPTIWFKVKYIVVIFFPISVGRLSFTHWSPPVLPFVLTVVGYLKLVGSLISFSPDFVSTNYLISTQNTLL